MCLQCLEKTWQRRYATALELVQDLQRYLEGRPVRARPIGPIRRGWRWCRRNPAWASALGAAVLGVAAFTVYQAVASERLRRETGEKTAALLRLRESVRRATGLTLDRSVRFCEEGDAGRGMLSLATALRMVPDDDTGLQRAIRINLEAWRPTLLGPQPRRKDLAHGPNSPFVGRCQA
jgi:hypothetical protein